MDPCGSTGGGNADNDKVTDNWTLLWQAHRRGTWPTGWQMGKGTRWGDESHTGCTTKCIDKGHGAAQLPRRGVATHGERAEEEKTYDEHEENPKRSKEERTPQR